MSLPTLAALLEIVAQRCPVCGRDLITYERTGPGKLFIDCGHHVDDPEIADWVLDASEVMESYARAARTLSDLDYKPFPDIATAIPELTELPANVVSITKAGA